MQVMARAENTVFLGIEVKETNLEILQWVSLTAKPLRLCAIRTCDALGWKRSRPVDVGLRAGRIRKAKFPSSVRPRVPTSA